jgi:ABC-2 type transport system ATP-binding protein
VQASSLGCRFGKSWALRDCSFELPAGRVAALVGPNGAGKTTLLNLLVGLLRPSAGEAKVFNNTPNGTPAFLAHVGFVAQDAPLYRDFTATDHLKMGRHLNATWHDEIARERLRATGIPLDRPASTFSGGQRAQLALALVAGKGPDLLLLDEPLASLDPLARREFLHSLTVTAATGTTVMLSSHLISDLVHICDFLIVIVDGRLRLAGDIDDLLHQHSWIASSTAAPSDLNAVSASKVNGSNRVLVRSTEPDSSPQSEGDPVGLEELVLAYLEPQAPDVRAASCADTAP